MIRLLVVLEISDIVIEQGNVATKEVAACLGLDIDDGTCRMVLASRK